MNITIRRIYMYLGFGIDVPYYLLDASKLDVRDDELSKCIQEQVYGKYALDEKSEGGTHG